MLQLYMICENFLLLIIKFNNFIDKKEQIVVHDVCSDPGDRYG